MFILNILLFSALYLIVFMLGASVFSFVNVVVYRLPRKMNYLTGKSICPACEKELKGTQMVPVFSYLLLRGKCGYCKSPIPGRYVLMEISGGVLALFTFLWYVDFNHFEMSALFRFLLVFAFLSVLAAIALIDAFTMEIPNGLVIFAAALGVGAVFLFPQISLIERGVGVLSVSVPFLLLALAINGAFGGGDIKLMAACGLFLGWKLNLTALFFALITGGGYGVYLLAAKKKGRKDHFAFGPFLCAGAALSLFFGQLALDWYMGFFTFG